MQAPARPAEFELAALTVFTAAMDRDVAERESWLIAECNSNAALLARVRDLIAADAANLSVWGTGGIDASPHAPSVPPPQVGVYRLEELIGAGGMGSVYRARRNDGLFEQTVAIKFIRPLDRAVEPLIDAERKLLARMEHPGIARIIDGGSTANGLHYLVMEFVSGVALDHYATENKLNARERVVLMREVCAGVAHAHQHLVVHCDIKPANVLVTGEGHPKLIDFGVARIQDVADPRPEGFTRAYTSPQRLAGAPAVVTDDVYSLGVTLCELLADRLQGDLAAIGRKATATLPDERYASVGALDDDLRRWLECRPVEAAGGAWRYRTLKLVERHPWRVAAASFAALGLIVALAVIATLYARADAARQDAERRFGEVRALANYMLFDLDRQLEATPGTTQTRREMVGRGQQYLDALAATAGDNAELQREVAVGLARLAEVQGVPGKAHVGEPAAAKANLERAERMLVELTARAPREMGWQRDLGRVRYLLALVYGAQDNNEAGQLEKARQAEANLLTALAGVERWSPVPADLAELHTLLTSSRLTQADVFKWREQYAAAASLQEQEEARLMALPAAVRQAMEFEYQSGRPAMMLGDSLFYLGRLEDALAAYRRATVRFEQGLVRTPRHRRLMDGVLIGYWSIAGTLDEMGRHDQALIADDRAVAMGERLVELDPENVEAWRMRDMARGQRALTLASLGRHMEAIRMIEQSVHERQERALQLPDDAERARDAAVPLRNLAQVYRDYGDGAGSCRALRQAFDSWTRIERHWGLSEFDRKNELAAVQLQLAGCPGL
jgi:serine/threonine-protein kinase